MRIIAETFAELVTGQTRETVGPAPGDDPIEHHLDGAGREDRLADRHLRPLRRHVLRRTPEQVEALRRYGAAVGMAFQISDDIIDIASPPTPARRPGTDLREGVRTLPVLYTLRGDPAADRLRELVAGPITDDAEVAEALELLRSSPGLERAREVLAEHARRPARSSRSCPTAPPPRPWPP